MTQPIERIERKQSLIKRSITLIEMIVVMILIATITGALAYNYKESLNEGKAFKTKEGISRIENIITIYLAEHPESKYDENWEQIISNSALVKDPQTFLRDGWGNKYEIRVEVNDQDAGPQVIVRSAEYERYRKKKGY